MRIRWRLHDPPDEHGSPRWTRVHHTIGRLSPRTLCGRQIPEDAYETDTDEQIPESAPTCRRCRYLNATPESRAQYRNQTP